MSSSSLTPLARTPQLRFRGVVLSEALKLLSLASVRWAALAALAAGVIGAVVQADDRAAAAPAALGATVFTSVVVSIIGAIAGSSEYATGAIQPSVMAVPRRPALLAAKTLVVALVGGVLSLIASLVGITVVGAGLTAEAVVVSVLAALSGAAIGAFAVGLSMIARSASVSIVGTLAVVVLMPGLAGGIQVGDGWLTDYLPTEAGGQLVLGGAPGQIAAAVVILLAWPVVTGLVALARLTRTDA